MAGSVITSSPLSTPPSSPAGSTTSAASETVDHSMLQAPAEPNISSTHSEVSQTDPPTVLHDTTKLGSPIPSTSDIIEENSPKTTPKRTREDEEPEDLQPAKKAAKKSKGKARPKAAVTTQKAPAKKVVAKKRTPPPPTPSSRPTRSRKAPDRFESFAEPSPPKATPAKKSASKVFDPVYITTNSTSRLGKADVYHMLLEPAAWTNLNAEQQEALVSMLPESDATKAILDKIQNGNTEDTRPQAFTMSNDCFRTDVARFKEDLKDGHLAKTWQAAAEQAVIARAAGEYDEWKAAEAELWWGQKSNTSD